MSVYIKGMEMPTDCIFCPMFRGAWTMCSVLNRTTIVRGRPDFCPLVPVPPHGDLFDISKVKITPSDDEDIAYEIDFGKTVIPAEPFKNLSKPCKDDVDFPICTKASPASLGIYKKAEEGE